MPPEPGTGGRNIWGDPIGTPAPPGTQIPRHDPMPIYVDPMPIYVPVVPTPTPKPNPVAPVFIPPKEPAPSAGSSTGGLSGILNDFKNFNPFSTLFKMFTGIGYGQNQGGTSVMDSNTLLLVAMMSGNGGSSFTKLLPFLLLSGSSGLSTAGLGGSLTSLLPLLLLGGGSLMKNPLTLMGIMSGNMSLAAMGLLTGNNRRRSYRRRYSPRVVYINRGYRRRY